MQRLTLAAACAALLLFGGVLASDAAARSPYGPSGLGANLHRTFVIKQAIKRSRVGLPVRNRAILWNARPYSRAIIVTPRRYRW